ncbi:MAG: nucleoside/nucleotide kinase family protein, partial [Pseudobutyrivibrio sp.]|nr:nucleoside/nucleotide kinase family protein [Pseudobutyrivibrio sp.]
YYVNINGIDVEARFDEECINSIFKPLLLHLAQLNKEKGKRLLVMLAAPPGAGKSTLVSFLESISKDIIPECKVQAIGMDGFHRRQEYLISHSAIVDGEEVSMVDIKGAPITFDIDKFREYIEQALIQPKFSWPVYDRHLHNPVENAITIDSDILLLEGNYLLLDEDGWKDISHWADYTISIKADPKMLRERLIDRKEKSGNTREKAEQFVDYSDMRNVRLCLAHSKKADLELYLKSDGNFEVGVI